MRVRPVTAINLNLIGIKVNKVFKATSPPNDPAMRSIGLPSLGWAFDGRRLERVL
jgi:hypothetical protein